MTDYPLDALLEGLPGLLDVLQASDIREIELRDCGLELRLHRAPAPDGEEWIFEAPEDAVPPIQPAANLTITSGLVGTFYRAGHPGSAPLVSEGSSVADDTIVGIIEALSVLTEVEAGCAGIVTRVFATDGSPVEYGQPLFEVEPRV